MREHLSLFQINCNFYLLVGLSHFMYFLEDFCMKKRLRNKAARKRALWIPFWILRLLSLWHPHLFLVQVLIQNVATCQTRSQICSPTISCYGGRGWHCCDQIICELFRPNKDYDGESWSLSSLGLTIHLSPHDYLPLTSFYAPIVKEHPRPSSSLVRCSGS